MRMLLALLLGALLAGGSAVMLVHNSAEVQPAPTQVLYTYGSGG
jgi:hypothetical protein